jgi:hypothetical protein
MRLTNAMANCYKSEISGNQKCAIHNGSKNQLVRYCRFEYRNEFRHTTPPMQVLTFAIDFYRVALAGRISSTSTHCVG